MNSRLAPAASSNSLIFQSDDFSVGISHIIHLTLLSTLALSYDLFCDTTSRSSVVCILQDGTNNSRNVF